MLICVCLKPALRTGLPLRLDPGTGYIHRADTLLAGDPGSRAALGAALAAAEAVGRSGPNGVRVAAYTVEEGGVGGAAASEPLREALAAGADEAYRVTAYADGGGGAGETEPIDRGDPQDPGGTADPTRRKALALAEVLRPREPVLVLTGERSADTARGCFGAFLAHALGADFAHRAGFIAPADIDPGVTGPGSEPPPAMQWRITALLEGGYGQQLTLSSPAVVTVPARTHGLAHPALPYPALPAWIASREADIPVLRANPPPLEDDAETVLRVSLPRVKTYTVPGPSLSAEERIAAMMEPGGPGGGEVLAGLTPARQAEAVLALLRKRGLLE